MSKIKKLKSKAYRKAYAEAHISQGIAFQIKALRESRGWKQADLAKLLSSSQSAVARLEDPSYGSASLATLKKLAEVFDVALLVKFASFSKLLREMEDLTPKALAVPSFEDEVRALDDVAVLQSDNSIKPYRTQPSEYLSFRNWRRVPVAQCAE